MARPLSAALLPILAATLLGCAASPDDGESAEGDAVLQQPNGDATAGTLDAEESAFLDRINAYRAANGLKAVGACRTLSIASERHSADMRDREYFGHKSPEGTLPPDRACKAGYNGGCFGNSAVGENIAAGFPTAEEVIAAWKSSAGHDATMRSGTYRVIGIGRVEGGKYGTTWTTVFGGDDEASCRADETVADSGDSGEEWDEESGDESAEDDAWEE